MKMKIESKSDYVQNPLYSHCEWQSASIKSQKINHQKIKRT